MANAETTKVPLEQSIAGEAAMITASCGCQVEDFDDLVDVEWEGEDCVAGEGFVPCTFFARYCRPCAVKFGHIEPEPEQ